MLNGWLEYYGIYYYFDKNGVMAANKSLTINGTKYTFNSNGSLDWDDRYEGTFNVKHTVKGDEPSFSILQSDKTDSNDYMFLLLITNNGKKSMKIYQLAQLSDPDYDSYDRTLVLVNEDAIANYGEIEISESPLTIKAGESKIAVFMCGDPTWYDEKTMISFMFQYDNATYAVTNSSKYGQYCTEVHYDFSVLLNELEDISDLL